MRSHKRIILVGKAASGKDHLIDASRYLITEMTYKPKTKYTFM